MKPSILLATVFTLALFGCSKAPDIVGTWHSWLGGANTVYHFRKHGSYTLEIDFDGMHALSNGKYHIEGGKLFLEPANFDVMGSNPRAEEVKAKMMQGARVTIQMQSPNTFRLGLEEPPLIVSRLSRDP